MWKTHALLRLIILIAQSTRLALAEEYKAFVAPVGNAPQGVRYAMHNLPPRDSSKCANSCAHMGYSNMGSPVCCPVNAACALDQVGNVACCPDNSVCTGTIAAPNNQPTAVAAAAAAPSSAMAPTAAPSASISHAISGTSVVPNSYYPYPVLPTTFAGADDCSSSYTACQAESAKCTGFIEGGGGYGVTVAGQGGVITQQGVLAPASAEAICSSLSMEACHGLNVGMCSTFGGAAKPSAGGNFVVGSQTSSGGAAPTRCAVMYGLGLGMAVGIAGQVVG